MIGIIEVIFKNIKYYITVKTAYLGSIILNFQDFCPSLTFLSTYKKEWKRFLIFFLSNIIEETKNFKCLSLGFF